MRFREGLVLVGLFAALGAAQSSAQPAPAAAASAPSAPFAKMSASAVRAAVELVQADPLLPGSEKNKVLRFKKDTEKEKAKPKSKDDASWWIELLANLSGGMRVAIWLVGAGLLIWVLLRLRDWLQSSEGSDKVAALPPSHVGSLDIRPESLPADIGAAALALWRRGETRTALSLLYRGALSRLVHGHGVPIRAASTESECLALAARRLAPGSQAFLAELVAGWQTVAYAGRTLAAEDMEQLCLGFETQLPSRASTGAPA